MKKYSNIIQSKTAPFTTSLWVHDGKVQHFNNGKWEDLAGLLDQDHIKDYQLYITDIVFVVGGDNSFARELFELYSFDHLNDYIPVLLVNGSGQNRLATLAMYYNGHITAIMDGKMIIYNVNYNDDTWPIEKLKTVDLTLLPTYVDLELGNTNEVKQSNIELLLRVAGTQFFVHADYGIGVGSWHSTIGGKATINTASGDRVHYIITAEGECYKDPDYFDHSELFYDLGVLDLSDISTSESKVITINDSVQISQFKRASNVTITIHTDNGDFEVNCPQVSVGPTSKTFNSPDIKAGNEDEWNYLKLIATINSDNININIETV